jgi:hypothetical protein
MFHYDLDTLKTFLSYGTLLLHKTQMYLLFSQLLSVSIPLTDFQR